MLAHNIIIRMFAKEDEDKLSLETAFNKLFNFPIEKLLEIIDSPGLEDNLITEYKIELKKQADIRKFLENLNIKITTKQKETLLEQADSRLDEDFHFFIRLEKEALLNNKIKLTDSGDCIHVKITLATFPKNKENAIKILKTIFDNKQRK